MEGGRWEGAEIGQNRGGFPAGRVTKAGGWEVVGVNVGVVVLVIFWVVGEKVYGGFVQTRFKESCEIFLSLY